MRRHRLKACYFVMDCALRLQGGPQLPHIASPLAVLSDWQGPICAGKRGREAGNESDDEAGASKRPRAGLPVPSCCSAQHCHQGTFCGMSCMGSDFLCERRSCGAALACCLYSATCRMVQMLRSRTTSHPFCRASRSVIALGHLPGGPPAAAAQHTEGGGSDAVP